MDYNKYQSLRLFGKTYQPEALTHLAVKKIKNPQIASWEKKIYWFILDWLHPSNSMEVKTSGSTGKAKTIHFSKDQMIASARATAHYFNFSENDPVLLALDMSYVAAKMMVVRAFVSSLDLYFAKPSSDPFIDSDFPKFKFVPLVPFQLKSIFQSSQSLEKLRTVSQVLVGGGAVDPELEQFIKQETNAYYASFGMAETLTHFAVKRINGPDPDFAFQSLEGVRIRQDENGCLQALVPWISSDYIATRDIVELLDGNSFVWKGRLDNLINSGGIKISPEAIEAKLAEYIAPPFFISALPDPMLGQKVVMFVESDAIEGQWYEAFDQVLEKYEKPKAIHSIPNFVYTTSNKINRGQSVNLFLSNRSVR
jgi:O-succinylbenzoic acid--CoA ligase